MSVLGHEEVCPGPWGGVASSGVFLGSSLPTLCPIDQQLRQKMTELENRCSIHRPYSLYAQDVISDVMRKLY